MTLKLHFTLLAANKVKLEKMNKSTESDFLEFLQSFQITYLPENGILVKSNNGSQLKNPEISGAIFTLSLSILMVNSQFVDRARDVRFYCLYH